MKKIIFLFVALLAAAAFCDVVTEVEPNDAQGDVNVLDVSSQTFSGEIATWTDRDWWKFEANAGDQVEFTPAATYGVALYLYPADGDNSYSLADNHSDFGVLTYDVTVAGTYKVQIAPYNSFEAYEYTMSGGSNGEPPAINGLTGELIARGEMFADINLDNLVSDDTTADEDISWEVTGGSNMAVEITEDRIAKVTSVNPDWTGFETLTFRATDTDAASDFVDVRFDVFEPLMVLDENFDASTNMPEFWSTIGEMYINSSNSYAGNCAKFVSADDGNAAVLVSPMIVKEQALELDFKYRRGNLGPVDFEVGTMSDPQDIATYTAVYTTSTDASMYEDIETVVIPAQEDHYFMAIKMTTTANYFNLFVDELTLAVPSSIGDDVVAETSTLYNNYPNPFNPSTTISYTIADQADVKLAVFNTAGEMVADLVNGTVAKGAHTAKFNAAHMNSGVYFYTLSVDNKAVATKKMILVK